MAEELEQTLVSDAPSVEEASNESSFVDSEAASVGDTPEQIEQKERSKLGRRVAKFEEEFGAIKQSMSRLDRIEAMLENLAEIRQAPANPEEEDPDRLLTVRELRELQQREGLEAQKARQKYENDYIRTVKGLYREDAANHALIEEELLTNVAEYPTWSNRKDAKADAIANYWKARAKVMEGKFKTSAPNVRGGANAPTGVTTSTRQAETSGPTVKLDDVASKFARAMQMDDDYVQNVLRKKE
jgi:hypothetical protein